MFAGEMMRVTFKKCSVCGKIYLGRFRKCPFCKHKKLLMKDGVVFTPIFVKDKKISPNPDQIAVYMLVAKDFGKALELMFKHFELYGKEFCKWVG